ncbi:MAG: hypothetical protein V1904_14630 [Bacteroidota bacterium]
MESKIKYLILFLAVISAVVLYHTGFKNLKLKKKNFFYTSLLIALTFLGCNFAETNARDPKRDEEQNKNEYGKDDPEFIKELNETTEWKEFKLFWKTIDQIEAAQGVTPDSYNGYITKSGDNYSSTYKIADSLTKRTKLYESFLKKLSSDKLLDTLESRLLINMCYERIDYICYGFKSMMMRMVVHPGITQKEHTMAKIEFRIDTIINLELQGKIESSEMNRALANTHLEIKNFGVLDIIGKYNLYRYLTEEESADFRNKTNPDSISIAGTHIFGFEKSYREFMDKYNASKADEQQKKLYDAYVTTKKELDAFMQNYSRFCIIIEDLIMDD